MARKQQGATVLLADPPWRHDDHLPGKGRGASKHYDTMTTVEICGYQLPPLAPNCLLLLWRCSSMQDDAIMVMEEWGFTLKSEIVWVKLARRREPLPRGTASKLHFGMGRYVRNAHETLLIATRGRVQVADHSIRSVFAAPVQEHSRKPDYQYEIAERLVPKGPYVELFARRQWPGWHSYGNELPRGGARRAC